MDMTEIGFVNLPLDANGEWLLKLARKTIHPPMLTRIFPS